MATELYLATAAPVASEAPAEARTKQLPARVPLGWGGVMLAVVVGNLLTAIIIAILYAATH